jgi:Ca2+-binding EF-hand superfamily protein
MNFPDGRQIGLIAQEVEEVIPELVNTTDNGYKSVDYAKLVSVLVEAVKEQQKQIEALEERISSIALKELDRESYGYIKTNINK